MTIVPFPEPAPKPVRETCLALTIAATHLHRTDVALFTGRTEHFQEQFQEHDGTTRHRYYEIALPGGFAVPVCEGWIVRVYPPLDPPAELPPHPFTDHLIHLMNWCRLNQVGYVRFDRDADELNELPTFPE